MLEALKKKLAIYQTRRLLRNRKSLEIPFNGFFRNTNSVLLIMPTDNKLFEDAYEIINFLLEQNKDLTVFLCEENLNYLTMRKHFKAFTYSEEDKSFIKLPSRNFLDKINRLSFDMVIDLNSDLELFLAISANFVNSKIRVGYVNEFSDMFYNFQIPKERNNEISQRNLLNSLKMF
ncbi:MAG: hypothetical protein JW995_07095 [Melioribacteraceae bacterium]|nr:hypothetical protein [Melioribacteraceae bacterium]